MFKGAPWMGHFLTNYGGTKMCYVFKVSRRGEFWHHFLLQSSVFFGLFTIKVTLEQTKKVQMGSRCIALLFLQPQP